MSTSTPTKPRPGRKPSGTALSNAERQRRYIARLKAQQNTVTNAIPSKALADLDAKYQAAVATIHRLHEEADELRRELIAARQQAAVSARDLADLRELRIRVSRQADSLADSRRTIAQLQAELKTVNDKNVRPTDDPPVTSPPDHEKASLTEKDYPPDAKALAVRMPQDGKTTAQTRAVELQATGQSLRQIAAALDAEGYPTRSGRGQWQPSTVRTLLMAASRV